MVSLTEELNMLQILAQHPTEDRKVVVTYLMDGYAEKDPSSLALPYCVSADVESSFVGASMFGWSAPVADEAHAWANQWFFSNEDRTS